MKCNDFFVIVFLGPNGCGKTTLASKLANSLKIPYVNIDLIGQQYFSHIDDYNEKMTLSANLTDIEHNEKLINQQSFITELALSNPKDLEFLNKVKISGAKLITVCVLTRNVEINISRIANRVIKGGHNVPEYKIKERYIKFFKNMPFAVEVSNLCFIYDNSYAYKILLAKHKVQNLEVICNRNDAKEDIWLTNKIIKPLEMNNRINFSSNITINDDDLFNKLFSLLSFHVETLSSQICLL